MTGPGARGAESDSYKWVVLSNTTLAMLVVSINQTIVLVALPAIFAGLHSDPLGPNEASYLLWLTNGYTIATTIFLLTFGRLADTHGKVRFYNLGFTVFGVASLLCAVTPSAGSAGALELIIFRFIQGIGGAMLFAVNLAILTDAFPQRQRGIAYAINQLAFVGGNVLGVVLGGVLAAAHWRLVFLINVPIALFGTIWSYLKLHEISTPKPAPPDWWGNIALGAGLIMLMLGLSYGIIPYHGRSLGWTNPLVDGALSAGLLLLAIFLRVEARTAHPMFSLRLFRIRAFAAANVANFFFAIARGGLQFILVIWLQAVWLPLHGVSFAATPLQAGLATLPLMLAFFVAAPIGGRLGDRHGARVLSTVGMLLLATALALFATLPPDFPFWLFATYASLVGVAMGLFSAPNSTQLFGSVAAGERGVATGTRQTLSNAGALVSSALFFTVVISGLSQTLPQSLQSGLAQTHIPPSVSQDVVHLPPATAVFSAEIGINPMTRFLPPHALTSMSQESAANILSGQFFARLVATPFARSIRLAFLIAAASAIGGALASALRGARVAAGGSDVVDENSRARLAAGEDVTE
jgi:EmrB/QacA subfamily drug resistance transporter